MCLVRLSRAVGDVVRPGEHRVLASDVDDVATHGLGHHDLDGGLGCEERALGHHIVLKVPVPLGRLEERLRDRQPGIVDEDVDAAVGKHASSIAARSLLGDETSAATRTASSLPPIPAATSVAESRSRSATMTCAPSTAQAAGGRRADARAAAGHECDPGASGFGLAIRRASPPQLPVLDAELLGLLDRLVGRDGLRAVMTLMALM